MIAPVVIFVRPQAAGNIGALARVMSNFSCGELRIVGDTNVKENKDHFSDIDWGLACRGSEILEGAQFYPSLKEALTGVHMAWGTSGKKDNFYDQGYSRPFVEASDAFEAAKAGLKDPSHKWALVFGNEADGLSSDEAALCQQLIHINTADPSPSINVAMAAGLLLYHWHLFSIKKEKRSSTPLIKGAFETSSTKEYSTLDEKEKCLEYLIETLKLTQFFKYPDHEGVKARLRRWFQSSSIPRGELLMAFEVIYQLKCWGQGHFEKRDFLGQKSSDSE